MRKGNRFVQNISANSLQLIVSNACGLIIFYVLSKQLNKTDFGNFNWSLAVILTSLGILSFGIDQLVVKKIATKEKDSILSLFMFHVLLVGGFLYTLLILSYFLFPSFKVQNYLLLFLTLGKLLLFFSSPYKQVCAGLEQFKLLFFMSVPSNIIKAGLLVLFYFLHMLSIKSAIVIFIMADLFELIVTTFIGKRYLKLPLILKPDLVRYKHLIKEALPQLGTVIFASTLARLDWILIGIFLYSAKLAEYSFAYKVFELSTFPLLIIAPLLIPLFARIFLSTTIDTTVITKLKFLLSIELIIASLTSMVLVIIWTPVMDCISDEKYGSVNKNTFFILSLCIPFIYFNNFLWTLNFARAKLRMIFLVFAATFAVNLIGDLVLIPTYYNEGAATAYLLALVTQAFYFIKSTKIEGLNKLEYPLLICPICALASGLLATYCFNNTTTILIVSVCLYLLSVIACLRISVPQYKILKNIIAG